MKIPGNANGVMLIGGQGGKPATYMVTSNAEVIAVITSGDYEDYFLCLPDGSCKGMGRNNPYGLLSEKEVGINFIPTPFGWEWTYKEEQA